MNLKTNLYRDQRIRRFQDNARRETGRVKKCFHNFSVATYRVLYNKPVNTGRPRKAGNE